MGKMILDTIKRFVRQTRDANFIGFEKYRVNGAYHWGLIEKNPDYAARVRWLASRVSAGSRCLDLGCGDGAIMGLLAGQASEIVGVDADFDGAAIARAELKRRQLHSCAVYQMPFSGISRKQAWAQAGFDVVYSLDVLEHLPDPRQLLSVAIEMLKPDGIVVIGTPLFISDALVSKHHVREYSQVELRSLLSEFICIEAEEIQPGTRKDGQCYPENYYMAAGRRK